MLYQSKKRLSYRPQKTNWITPRLFGIILLLASVGLLLYTASQDESQATSFGMRVLHSPITLANGVRNYVGGSYDSLMANINAKRELEALKLELEEARHTITELQFKLSRHDAIRDALKLPREAQYQTIPAIVQMRNHRFTKDLIINRGSSDGLEKNMPVWTEIGLVGRTRTLSDHFSLVQRITDPGSSVGVEIANTPIKGILRGSDDGETMLLTDQYRDQVYETGLDPIPGQQVFTSGDGMIFPGGLLAGTVSDVTSDYGIVVEPAVDFRSVQSVLVHTDTTLRDELVLLLDGVRD